MINPMSLEEKTIIVTGAASGIGRETALLLYKLGAKLLLLDLNEDGLKKVAEELEGGVSYRAINLMNFDSIKEILMEAKKELGSSFTGLVHCAGIPSVVPLRALTNDQYENVMRINTQAGLNLAKVFTTKQGHDPEQQGSIVFISSVYGEGRRE